MVFSEQELALVFNANFIYQKNKLLQNVSILLGELAGTLQDKMLPLRLKFNAELLDKSGKISRGEQYKGLPYLVLDAPFLIKGKEFLICRTLFWWGNYITFNILIKGSYFKSNTLDLMDKLKMNQGILFLKGTDLWDNDLSSSGYEEVNDSNISEIANQFNDFGFLRLSKKLGFEDLGLLEEKAIAFYQMLI